MKSIFFNKLERAEFFFYYVLMTILGLFISVQSFLRGSIFYFLGTLALIIVILNIIILFSYFRKVMRVRYLLQAYLWILALLFILSTVAEVYTFSLSIFAFVMKTSLYLICLSIPVKHLVIMNEKISQLSKK